MDFEETVAAAVGGFQDHDCEVMLVADGEPEIGFYGRLSGGHRLCDEPGGDEDMALEFVPIADGVGSAGGITLREGLFRGAEWRDIERHDVGGNPLPPHGRRYLAIELGDDREVWLCRLG